MSRPLPRPLGIAAALVTTVSWGGQFVVGKAAFAFLDPVWLTALRYAAAGLLMALLLLAVEGRAAFARDPALPRVAVLGTVGFAGFNLLAYVGLTRTTPQAASLLVSTMPLITAFVLWARSGTRPRPVTWWTSAVALLGVAVVLTGGHPARVLHGGLGWGDLLVLAGAASWVVYTTGAGTVPDWSPLRYTGVSAAAGATSIVLVALVLTCCGVLSLPTVAGIEHAGWELTYVALVAGVLAVLCWNLATRSLGAQDGVLFINVVPVTTFAVEALRGQLPHPGALAGVAITLGALVANNLATRRPDRRGSRPARRPEAGAAPDPRAAGAPARS